MVVGAYVPCNVTCEFREACAADSSPFDMKCPCYKDFDKTYHKLSNSNQIEVDSYLEGEMAPVYSSFTRYVLNRNNAVGFDLRNDFWNHIAFYNYHQAIKTMDFLGVEELEVPDSDTNFFAFKEVLETYKPEVIYVWFDTVCRILRSRQIPGLQEIDRVDANGTTVYRFAYQVQSKDTPKNLLAQFGQSFPEVTESERLSILL